MLLENLKGKKVILASKSPRRQSLLKGLEIDFEIRTKEVEEIYPNNLKPYEVAEYLSDLKSSAFQDELKYNDILITSDTIVVLNNSIIEKPGSRDESYQMLSSLSGKGHEVITGVCLANTEKKRLFHETTKVYFNELTDREIFHYIDHYKPYDKAGSYGVQELMGYIGIRKLEGCYYNVMGLPLQKLYNELKNW